MRLAYRIATMKPLIINEPRADSAETDHWINRDREILKLHPKLNLDNVAEYWAQSNVGKCIGETIPNWTPPFEYLFAEWKAVGPGADGCVETGVGVSVVDSANPDELAAIEKMFSQSQELPLHEKTKLVLICSMWVSDTRKPILSSPVWTGFVHAVFVDKLGAFLGMLTLRPAAPVGHKPDPLAISTAQNEMMVLGMGLSFMNCKNVKRIEQAEPRKESWHAKEKCPVFRFHTLDINPMKEVLRTEGQSESTGLKRALHICRGHFAHYSEEKPLFGKYAGDFFVPSHVRGSLDQGVVAKDYNVKL